jgi:hypothetical protein
MYLTVLNRPIIHRFGSMTDILHKGDIPLPPLVGKKTFVWTTLGLFFPPPYSHACWSIYLQQHCIMSNIVFFQMMQILNPYIPQ